MATTFPTKSRFDFLALLAITVYFVQGAVIVTILAEFFLTRNIFQFDWIQLALLTALGTLTWSVKPIYGFLTDLLPLFGSRRKNYLIIASILPVLAYAYLTFFGISFASIAFCIIIANIGLGFADVITDGLIVERSTAKTVGWYQALCWRSKALGIFFATLFSGMILERRWFTNWAEPFGLDETLAIALPNAFPLESGIPGVFLLDIRFTFLAAGLLPLLTLLVVLIGLKEEKVSKALERKAHEQIPITHIVGAAVAFVLTAIVLIYFNAQKADITPFINNSALSSLLVMLVWAVWILSYVRHLIGIGATTSTLLFAALFVFLWRFTPSFGAPWNEYWLNTLALSQEQLGMATTVQPIAWIVGSFIYVHFLDKVSLIRLLFWTVIIAAILDVSKLLLAEPELGQMLGNIAAIKYLAAIVLMPAYLLGFGTGAWSAVMAQAPILNLDVVITFITEMMFIIAFLPLLKLAALVTPKGVEATNFAVLASIMNFGLAFGAITGGMIYTRVEGGSELFGVAYSGLQVTILVGVFASLLCLPVLKYIRLPKEKSPAAKKYNEVMY